jgi:calcineurin-like phosphoesterase family protein
MKYWFTSDWHLGHENIIRYSNRPFKTVEEMDWAIINNHNKKVDHDDIVYFLGDFTMRKLNFQKYIEYVNGKIIFILGNHDMSFKNAIKNHYKIIEVHDRLTITIDEQIITLCHYPPNKDEILGENEWYLYGHKHSDTNKRILGKKMNVNLELHDYKPLSFDNIKEFMTSRTPNSQNNNDFLSYICEYD